VVDIRLHDRLKISSYRCRKRKSHEERRKDSQNEADFRKSKSPMSLGSRINPKQAVLREQLKMNITLGRPERGYATQKFGADTRAVEEQIPVGQGTDEELVAQSNVYKF